MQIWKYIWKGTTWELEACLLGDFICTALPTPFVLEIQEFAYLMISVAAHIQRAWQRNLALKWKSKATELCYTSGSPLTCFLLLLNIPREILSPLRTWKCIFNVAQLAKYWGAQHTPLPSLWQPPSPTPCFQCQSTHLGSTFWSSHMENGGMTELQWARWQEAQAASLWGLLCMLGASRSCRCGFWRVRELNTWQVCVQFVPSRGRSFWKSDNGWSSIVGMRCYMILTNI